MTSHHPHRMMTPPACRRIVETEPANEGVIATRSGKEALVTTYEIRVIGSFGPAVREAFADMMVEVEPTITVLSGDLDQHSLHTLLDRVRAAGLELVGVRQAPLQ
jgi:hypothetical protein